MGASEQGESAPAHAGTAAGSNGVEEGLMREARSDAPERV